MIGELFTSVREQTAGRYEVIGELARDDAGGVVCLGREAKGGALVALWLRRTGTRPDGSGEYAVEVTTEIDGSILPPVCPVCAATHDQPYRTCPSCGANLSGSYDYLELGYSPSDLLTFVRESAGADYEVLGDMPRA